MICNLYFRRYVNFVLQTYCNWTVDDPIFALIFCERSTYFLELIVLILLKTNLSVRNNFFPMMNMFSKELWSQIYVIFFLICAIDPLCVHRTIKVDSILYQKFALWTFTLTFVNLFGMRCHCYILVEIIYW